MTVKKGLESHLETLRNDFLLKSDNYIEASQIIAILGLFSRAMKDGKFFDFEGVFNEPNRMQRFKRILKDVYEKLSNDDFIKNYEHSEIMLQTMILERIFFEDKFVQENKVTRIQESLETQIKREEYFNAQMLLKLNFTKSYFEALETLDVNDFDRTAMGWNSVNGDYGEFSEKNISSISYYSDFAKKDSRLKNLAEKIGHHSDKNEKLKKILGDGKRPAVAYDGIFLSNNLKTLLPSEIAMKSNPKTRLEFLRRFSEHQLLCYKPSPENNAAHGMKESKGPVVICLDTSGSMQGIPETVAKALTLEVIKSASKENRSVFLISFSIGFETLQIGDIKKIDELKKLTTFLNSSFYGGTDISQAFLKALEVLSQNEFSNADILLVSDFVTPNFDQALKQKLQSSKKLGNLLYALSIGSRGNKEILTLCNQVLIFEKNKFI